jgi:hypothetical protein
MQVMVQLQCQAGRQLDGGNPNYETLRKDFERFGLNLTSELATQPANAVRQTHLGHLNQWRNYAAHHKTTLPPVGGPFVLATVSVWKSSCDGLATELDRIMYNQLQALTGAAPW